ncbi:MAG: cyclic nucleotide-binding domain-containing protein [Actinomycetota bacterium]
MAAHVRDVGDATLFATCPAAEREFLKTLAVPLRVTAGQDIVGQGEFGSTIGVILEGRASVWLDEEHVADLEPGDCYGELAVLTPPGQPARRAARVRADSEVRVDTVAGRDLSDNLAEIPTIADRLREQATRYRG